MNYVTHLGEGVGWRLGYNMLKMYANPVNRVVHYQG